MKKLSFISLTLFIISLLSGCQAATTDGSLFHDYLIRPFSWALHEIGTLLDGNFGLALILITVLVRLLLLPFMLKTYKNQQVMKEKMEVFKPELEAIQKKMKQTNNPEEKQKLQQEMMGLYQKHGVNPLNMGCLPLIIQTPILIGLYYAIRTSTEIASHSFLWFNLGEVDYVMAIIAGLVYFLQSRVALIGMPETQQSQMKIVSYLSPLMILIFSFNAPSALPLYWAAGGIFLIVQTYVSKKLYQSKKTITNEELVKN
ncbi:membrane protein insertase YidC [Bacillus seohaeanensis]|uniref:Membrane protein insertase YidC n=1 Tax=Bacillus seohaeanensis TaxID=284580 RepID=A0ABW5RTV6_9BACI